MHVRNFFIHCTLKSNFNLKTQTKAIHKTIFILMHSKTTLNSNSFLVIINFAKSVYSKSKPIHDKSSIRRSDLN